MINGLISLLFWKLPASRVVVEVRYRPPEEWLRMYADTGVMPGTWLDLPGPWPGEVKTVRARARLNNQSVNLKTREALPHMEEHALTHAVPDVRKFKLMQRWSWW